jgi:hypothetical protein
VQARGQIQRGKVPDIPEALAQSQVRFSRVLEKVSEKVPEKVTGRIGAEP